MRKGIMKAEAIRNLSQQEIEKMLRDTRQELLNLRLRKQSGQVEKTHELRELRREIARLQTIIKERRAAVSAQ